MVSRRICTKQLYKIRSSTKKITINITQNIFDNMLYLNKTVFGNTNYMFGKRLIFNLNISQLNNITHRYA